MKRGLDSISSDSYRNDSSNSLSLYESEIDSLSAKLNMGSLDSHLKFSFNRSHCTLFPAASSDDDLKVKIETLLDKVKSENIKNEINSLAQLLSIISTR